MIQRRERHYIEGDKWLVTIDDNCSYSNPVDWVLSTLSISSPIMVWPGQRLRHLTIIFIDEARNKNVSMQAQGLLLVSSFYLSGAIKYPTSFSVGTCYPKPSPPLRLSIQLVPCHRRALPLPKIAPKVPHRRSREERLPDLSEFFPANQSHLRLKSDIQGVAFIVKRRY